MKQLFREDGEPDLVETEHQLRDHPVPWYRRRPRVPHPIDADDSRNVKLLLIFSLLWLWVMVMLGVGIGLALGLGNRIFEYVRVA